MSDVQHGERGLHPDLKIAVNGPNVFESVDSLSRALDGWNRAGWSFDHVAQDLMVYRLCDDTDLRERDEARAMVAELVKALGEISAYGTSKTHGARSMDGKTEYPPKIVKATYAKIADLALAKAEAIHA